MEHKCPSCGHKFGTLAPIQKSIRHNQQESTKRFFEYFDKMIAAGYDIDAIADELDITREGVFARLRRNGRDTKPYRKIKSDTTPPFVEKFTELQELGLSLSEIREKMGVDRTRFLDYTRRYGLRPVERRGGGPKARLDI